MQRTIRKKGHRSGRMKPCAQCGTPFYCVRCRDVGGSHGEQFFCSRACNNAAKRAQEDDVATFNAKVQRGPDDACWPFTGARVPSGGYGRVRFNKRLIAAHRVAYMLAFGNIPAGLDIMHSCDNPPCCNPAHLKAGTTAENMQDCFAKGRGSFPGNKLDEAKAREILALKGVLRAVDVKEKYGLSLSSIHNIWTGKAWKSIRAQAQE